MYISSSDQRRKHRVNLKCKFRVKLYPCQSQDKSSLWYSLQRLSSVFHLCGWPAPGAPWWEGVPCRVASKKGHCIALCEQGTFLEQKPPPLLSQCLHSCSSLTSTHCTFAWYQFCCLQKMYKLSLDLPYCSRNVQKVFQTAQKRLLLFRGCEWFWLASGQPSLACVLLWSQEWA